MGLIRTTPDREGRNAVPIRSSSYDGLARIYQADPDIYHVEAYAKDTRITVTVILACLAASPSNRHIQLGAEIHTSAYAACR
jgi:hypothetical protein